MVYVKDKTVWEYKLLTRNFAKEEGPNEAELNAFCWSLLTRRTQTSQLQSTAPFALTLKL